SQAPLFHSAGLEVLNDNVHLPRQTPREVLSLRAVEIECDALLVTTHDVPPKSRTVMDAAPTANRIPSRWRLDLDDFCTKPRHKRPRERSGQHMSEFKHAQTLKGLRRICTIRLIHFVRHPTLP